MSVILCEICDNFIDSDFVECIPHGDGMACLSCANEEEVEQYYYPGELQLMAIGEDFENIFGEEHER